MIFVNLHLFSRFLINFTKKVVSVKISVKNFIQKLKSGEKPSSCLLERQQQRILHELEITVLAAPEIFVIHLFSSSRSSGLSFDPHLPPKSGKKSKTNDKVVLRSKC